MTKPTLLTLSVLLLSGCEDYALEDIDWAPEGDEATESLRLDVIPADGGMGLLPQSFPLEAGLSGTLDLRLSTPVTVEGVVYGYQITPFADGQLPGFYAPIPASVSYLAEGSAQSVHLDTDDEGTFRASVVPGDYELVVVPDVPDVPVVELPVSVLRESWSAIELPVGVAVWGRVMDGQGSPVAGAWVSGATASGNHSPAAVTDAEGHYLLRAIPGSTIEIICDGRDNGRDPTVTSGPLLVGDEGLSTDLIYPELDFITVSGRVYDTDGAGVSHATLRFQAVELTGYPEGTRAEVEAVSGPTGTFDVRVLPGAYRVDVIPMSSDALSPMRLGRLDLDSDVDIGGLPLSGLVSLEGDVVGPDQIPVPSALVQIQEAGFGQRSWSVYTDALGHFSAEVSATPLEVMLIASGDLSEQLPLTRITLEPSLAMEVLSFAEAEWTDGTVRDPDGAALPWAVVEMRDQSGTLLGVTMSDQGGHFKVGRAVRQIR
ncbi:MAG: carboxypeptidase regulatory-like domain-containing protein [Deltaproteobacteria bacterium]|nr:carboxypeptidase regulatory-like domain-containing protein [Deltaproteobacteria bacterium]